MAVGVESERDEGGKQKSVRRQQFNQLVLDAMMNAQNND